MRFTCCFFSITLTLGLANLAGCDARTASDGASAHDHGHDHGGHDHDHDGHDHDGHDHDGHDHNGHDHDDHDGHGHDRGEEMPLPPLVVGDLSIACSQFHGPLQAGTEGHLAVKLPYSDGGASAVRAWIGGEDRTMSMVGLGVYAASHGDYDIHTMAPDPLPADARWWIEIERPDGTTLLGSVAPIVD